MLGIEVESRLAVESVRATSSNTLLVASEREHWQRYRDGHIDTNLTGLDLFLEFACCCAGGGKDGYAIAVFVLVDKLDCFVESFDIKADEDGAKDFFAVAAHVLGDVGYYGWANLKIVISIGSV